jgi:hypothetical protein
MTTPTKKTPTWLIERVAQKELGATEVEQIRVRLAAEGSSLEAEVDLLQRSDREILTQFPRQTMAKEIRRRAVGASQPRRGRRLRLPILLAPAVLLGSAALVVVIRGGRTDFVARGMHEAGGQEEIGIKGDMPVSPRLLVYRQKSAKAPGPAGSERLSDGARADRGDVIQLAYDKAPDGLYGVLLSIDGVGRVTLHLPEEGTSASAALTALRETPLPSAYELDDAVAFERFILISSPRPFAVGMALDAAHALVRRGPAAQTASLPLDPSYRQTSVLLHKIGKGVP